MEYMKFEIDNLTQDRVICQYREITEEKKGEFKSRVFPLELLGEHEPKILELVKGDITGIYLEYNGEVTHTERKQFGKAITALDEETVEYCLKVVKNACVQEKWDDLLKPPSVDEQVEEFLKEFFPDNEEEPLEPKDFLAEFFAELEEEADSEKE
jgi:hypothetical protein